MALHDSDISNQDVASVQSALGAQVGFSPTSLQFKVLSCRVWGPNPATQYNEAQSGFLRAQFYALSDSSIETRHEAEDTAGGMSRARIGYRWPISDSQRVFRSSEATVPLFSVSLTGFNSYTAYVEVSYRSL